MESSDKKLLVFGPPNCGKTSILLSIFGSVESELILNSPSEPTIGVDSSVYQWGHVKIGVFDLAGQEMEIFLTQERDYIFPGTDELLMVFEYGMNPKKIVNLLLKLAKIIEHYSIPYYYILIHKIDKAPTEAHMQTYLDKLQETINETFGMDKLKVFGTSLYPEYMGKFKFQLEWMLTALEISFRKIKELKSVPVSEDLLRSLRTAGFIDVSLEEEKLVEPPEINPKGYNEMQTIKFDREFKEVEKDD